MKPLDVVQLVLGIIVGTCVLRPIAGIPPAAQEVEWPRELELTKDENKEAGEMSRKASQLLCRAKYCSNSAASLPKALASMPPRAGAFVSRKRSTFWGTRGPQTSTKNLDINNEENSKEEETVMIATHHGCEVF